MAVNQPLPHFRMSEQAERATKAIGTTTGMEMIGSGAGIVLSILGLVGIIPPVLAAIALIVLGVSLFLESAAVATHARAIEQDVALDPRVHAMHSGLSLTAIAGVAVAVLGILTLLGIVPDILLGAGVITLGAAAVLSSGESERIGNLTMVKAKEAAGAEPGSYAITAPAAHSGLVVLAGVGAIVLGILALLGVNPLTLELVGMLAVSSAMFLSTAALAGGMAKILAH
jgi:hypothetical protein